MFGLLLILLAHDYWVMPSNWVPAVDDTVYFTILSGHDFNHPENDILPRMVRSVSVKKPDGTVDTLESSLKFSYVPMEPGLYTVRVELGPKRLPKPRYILYTLIRVGNRGTLNLPEEFGEIQGNNEWVSVKQPLKLHFQTPTYVTILQNDGSEETLKGKTVVVNPKYAGPLLISLEKNKPVVSVFLEVIP